MGLGLRAGRFCHHRLVTHHTLCDYWTILTINEFIFPFLLKNFGSHAENILFQKDFFFPQNGKNSPQIKKSLLPSMNWSFVCMCVLKKMNKSYVCVLFYFILSQILAIENTKEKKKHILIYFWLPTWTMYGNLDPNFVFLENFAIISTNNWKFIPTKRRRMNWRTCKPISKFMAKINKNIITPNLAK